MLRSYLVETYLARSREGEARAAGERLREAAGALADAGASVRYVRTTFLPEDETCFHLVEAHSRGAVEELSRRADLGRARIVPAIEAFRATRPQQR